MSAEAKSGGLTEYITHHLTHNTGSVGEGAFWNVHWDSLIVSAVLGALMSLWFWSKARKATAGVWCRTDSSPDNAGLRSSSADESSTAAHSPAAGSRSVG